jgi:hypothetical protein
VISWFQSLLFHMQLVPLHAGYVAKKPAGADDMYTMVGRRTLTPPDP